MRRNGGDHPNRGNPFGEWAAAETSSLTTRRLRAMNVWTEVTVMPLETKFLRLQTPVTIGSRFGDWEVSWLGGWTRNRLCYLVMVVRVPLCAKLTNSRRGVNGPHLGFASGLAIPAQPLQ